MKEMLNIVILLIIIPFLIGCAALPVREYKNKDLDDFFGAKMDSVSDVKDLIFGIDRKRNLFVNYNSSKIDIDVYAWGKIETKKSRIVITVINMSNIPIETFGDKFTLITKNGNTYDLEKQYDFYHSKNYINPKETDCFFLLLPPTIGNLKKKDVEMVICELGLETTIILKPVPV